MAVAKRELRFPVVYEDPCPLDNWIPNAVKTTGWYISFVNDYDQYGRPYLLSFDDGRDLYFASERDALRASDALYAEGIRTDEQLSNLSDEECRRICYGALAW